MTILDCETVKSTYRSIEDIMGISRSKLNELFNNIDLEKYYKENPNCYYDGEELLWNLVRKEHKQYYYFDGCY